MEYLNGSLSEFGPYVGPVLMDYIDGSLKYDLQVVNLFKGQVEKSLFDYFHPKPVFPSAFHKHNEPLVSQLKMSKPAKQDSAVVRSSQLKGRSKTIRDRRNFVKIG